MAVTGYVALGKILQGEVQLVGLVDSGETDDAGNPIWLLATDSASAQIGQIGDQPEAGTVIGLLQGILDALEA